MQVGMVGITLVAAVEAPAKLVIHIHPRLIQVAEAQAVTELLVASLVLRCIMLAAVVVARHMEPVILQMPRVG
jgi:hypothetical protein